jgi:hypothetical protein
MKINDLFNGWNTKTKINSHFESFMNFSNLKKFISLIYANFPRSVKHENNDNFLSFFNSHTGIMFPLFSVAYTIAPHSSFGQTMRKPFIKFICHSASYFTFLCKLYGCKYYLNLSHMQFMHEPQTCW